MGMRLEVVFRGSWDGRSGGMCEMEIKYNYKWVVLKSDNVLIVRGCLSGSGT